MKKKRGKKFKLIVGGVAAAVVVVGVVIGVRMIRAKNASPAGAVKRSTTTLTKMDLTDSISASGTIESKKTRSVTAQVNDVTVQKIYVKVGDEVKKGDKLVSFDSDSLSESLSEAQDSLQDVQSSAASEVESAQEQYDTAVSDRNYNNAKAAKNLQKAVKARDTAKKAVKTAKTKLKQVKKKAGAKNSQDVTTAQEALTKAQEAYEQAKTAVETARDNKNDTARQNKSSVTQAQTALKNAQTNRKKNVKEAQKQVTSAQEAVAKCAVTAPMDGVVTSLNVSAGDTYTGGTIVQLDDTSGYTITTSVDEYDISNVKKGQRVVILTEATDEDELEGVVTFVAPSTGSTSTTTSASSGNGADAGNSSSDGYEVRIRIKTTDSRIKMGMTAKCSIVRDEAKDVFAVPYDAVSENADGTYYITVVDGSGSSTGYTTQSGDNSQDRSDNSGQSGDSGQRGKMGNPPEKDETNASDDSTKGAAKTRQITVTKGMETDYYVEISGDDLEEGLEVVMPTDKVSDKSSSSDSQSGFGSMNGMGGGMPDSGGMGGSGNKGGFGGGPGGGK